jgi:hypothetical protein
MKWLTQFGLTLARSDTKHTINSTASSIGGHWFNCLPG